jgi:uncharacterized protein YkwD
VPVNELKAGHWSREMRRNATTEDERTRTRGRPARLAGLIVAFLACAAADARGTDLVDRVNVLRSRGCSGAAGAPTGLKQTRALDAVAKEWSKGGRLQQALERTGYRAVSSSSMRISGAANEQAIVDILAQHYCSIVTNREFTDIGIERRGRDAWLVVATPLNLPSARDANRIAREVLVLVNEARSKPRKCGRTSFAAAQPVTLSATLNKAALQHAQDMARHSHFEHEGTDGSTPADRATRAGYRWRHVAENIAAGAPNARAVVDGWLASPGHCANIMSPQYREMGIAFALNPQSKAGIYWAQTLATAR